ncbi:helix-turn-helix domain-containing protein [Sediminispirochaeta smaragdinae]|uniref:Transcriptional regulator, AraC family n=1 Tax=Sediminispirochaeta smaragdinae (strain DSM 11293 / JCM 15392 / SEBR 4228) TaxID=573413 RepID=E1R2B7_SEDSS|nr:helix-turn-helix domain-containing protein [Sediminispirochaeta smaragdinae]ADK82477.1 transcriptional regulator, AraC family [Sediminispirochaeta smaragdinae DSM 11293]
MMKKNILPFNWQEAIKDIEIHALGDDLMLFEQAVVPSVLHHPVKVDVTSVVICRKGNTKGTVNLRINETKAPCLIILPQDSILQFKEISDDFSALFIIMSGKFLDSLNLEEKIPLWLSVRETPYIPLTEETLQSLIGYYEMIKNTMRYADNPYLIHIARHLTIAFFYGLGYGFHLKQMKNKEKTISRSKLIFDSFLQQVRTDYKKERGLNYYADRLCLSPKYLSKVILDSSGKSPMDWIREYVIHDAQALLKSTDLTIQQISDELNFPSQSFFGKYFKGAVGMSPKNYRLSD